jgi:4-hydroxy-tetrahydrodipicolinate synthase
MSFEGVHAPLVTPFTADGEIDHALLAKHARGLVGRLTGMGVGGTTGINATTANEEKKGFAAIVQPLLRKGQ